ncbi:MAG: hypothetical protein JO314_07630 [Acidobacteria bacterium]|nr:hypothetical protein [Acidobacteriota bacterium]
MRTWTVFLVTVLALTVCVSAQETADKDIAAKFSPIFHQALGGHERGDYPTNFDFDGDWIGTNNWKHAGDPAFKLRGYIYYSVAETATHYYIHYAVFHARDYKGGTTKGVLYSNMLWLGAKILSRGHDPSGKLAEAAIAHENDMEGALVVVEKATQTVQFVETVHHNRFGRYVPVGSKIAADGFFRTSGAHPELYIQPKGHGIEALGTETPPKLLKFDIYTYTGVAGDPEASTDGHVTYDLLPISTTLWPRVADGEKNKTYASAKKFGTVNINVAEGGRSVAKEVQVGTLPSAFDGHVGGVNMARPPWGWFSVEHHEDAPGLWYFDPARIIKRDFGLGDSFSTAYLSLPFWAQKSDDATTAAAQGGERK